MFDDLATPPAIGDETGATPVAPTPSPAPIEAVTEVVAPSPESLILSQLRERRAKIGQGSDPLDLDIPGYGGDLVIRYKWTPFSELTATAPQLQRITQPTAQALAACADTLVAACEEVLIRVEGEVRPLSTDGTPIRFDDRLADALGFDRTKTARQCAMQVFKNDYALIEQSEAVMEWLRGTSQEVNDTFLGE